MANPVGSVTAEIILDTKQFEEAVGKLKGEVDEIKGAFNKKSGSNGLLEEVKSLKKEIESLQSKVSDYKDKLSSAKKEVENLTKTNAKLSKELNNAKKAQDNFNNGLKEEQKNLENVTKSASKYVKLQDRMTKFSMKTAMNNLKDKGMGYLFNLGAGRGKYADFSQWIKSLNKGQARFGFKSDGSIEKELSNQGLLSQMIRSYQNYNQKVKESIELERQRWSQASHGITGYINLTNQLRQSLNKINNSTETIKRIGEPFSVVQNQLKQMTTLVKTTFKQTAEGIEVIVKPIGKVSEVLSTFNFKLVELADKESIAARNAIELASAMQRMNTQGAGSWQGRQTTGGYSNYIGQSNSIAQTLKKQAQSAKEAKYAVEGLSQAYSKINLNSYKSNLNQINKVLEQQRLRTAQLEAAQSSLYYKNAPNNLNTYKMNMDKINSSLEKQTSNHRKNNEMIKQGQMSMREFGTRMGAAEAYSNNLYRGLQKVRSVIISMKTIMGAMGAMAVWNFAFGLIDKAKETYNAKNEMESILNQNSKMNAEGVQIFNQALDETVARFQKINKYSLGETAAGIGLEFELNAKEMSKSLDIIAMVQNEYVRAGRTTEEAALAVKDILQGEFMRLSRETGIGKDDLIEKYGWNGKKEDVMDLMRALEKAGKARHWDLFAEKATSVNDVITITQNRFGELGADLITHAEPMIVGAFNTILGAADKLKAGFESMGTFGKYTTIFTAGTGGFVAISTALMMFKRNMGLAQIATLGWGKSFFTALLGLNKTDVAMHGFLKTLTATISGTKASTVANIGLGKSIAARLLGVKHATVAERGLLTAMVQTKMQMKGVTLLTDSAAVSSLKWYQKIGYLNGGLKATEVQTAGLRKSLLNLSVASKAAKLALLGITSVAIIGYFASVATWTDAVKKRMEVYRDTLNKGKDEIKEAKDDLDSYQKKLDGLNKGDKGYNLAKRNRDTVQNHIKDLELSVKLAKQIKKNDKEISKSHDVTYQGLLDKSYARNGVNVEKYGQTYLQMKQVAYDMQKAEDERYGFLYKSSQHINEQVNQMKKANVSEEDRVKYITEYSSKAQEAAENLKKFNQGDINAGAYYLMNRAQLMWIDLWNNQHFIKFWEGVKKTWSEVEPSVMQMKDTLISIGERLADFFATDFGRWTGLITGLGVGIGVVGLKIGKWVTGSGSVFEVLKKVGGKVKDLATGWGKVAENADKATKKMEGSTSTGGIAGGTSTSGSLKNDLKAIGKNRIKSFTNNALIIAEGMVLVTEAILLLKLPMYGLSEVGKDFKAQESQIQEGIEGLKLVAPIIITFLVPIVALHQVLSHYGKFMSSWGDLGSNLKAFATMILGIAAGMLLVAETITLVIPSIWALGALGNQYQGIEREVHKGTEAMKVVTDSLMYLAPFIPALALGITTVALAFANPMVGAIMGTAITLGIPIGMLWVAETIWSLEYPLGQIANLGSKFNDLNGVKKGAEVIKVTAEALGYVNNALTSLTGIDLNLLAQSITDIVGRWFGIGIGTKLSDLTKEDGVLDQLNEFVKSFNSDKFTIEAPDQDKVTALGAAGDGVKTIGDAMLKVKTAMDNLPDEFKNGGTGFASSSSLVYNGNADKQAGQVNANTVIGYFDQFKEPIKQLKTFVDEFNKSEDFNIQKVDEGKLSNLEQSASMISRVNTAVEKVKTTMQNVGQAGHDTAFAQGGWFGAFGYDLFHQTGLGAINNGQSSGNYKSSIGSSLQAMEDVIDDIFTFQSNISSKSGSKGENANVDGATAMVTTIQNAISKLATSLSNSLPTFQGKGNAISQAIIKGINTGLNGMPNIPAKIANKIMTNKETLYNTVNSLGVTSVRKFKEAINPMDEVTGWELYYVNQKFKNEWYDKIGTSAYNLGVHASDKYQEGLDMHSPGRMARATADEINFIGQALTTNSLPQMAMDLGTALSSNFHFDLSNIQLPDVTAWASKLTTVIPTINTLKTQVSTTFNGMKTNVQNSFNNIVTKTRTSLTNMQSATTKNIGNIKTSWRGMQNALIASAEHIRSQTTSKINKLKSNLGDFWDRIRHPDKLIGSVGANVAGGHKGSIRRRFGSQTGHYAGGTVSRSQSLFKPKTGNGSPSDLASEYLKCLFETGKPCYAGGWNFNWTNKISKKFKGWRTHFGKYHLDDYLNVGKFEHSNFPVKGNADLAKSYIFDVIRATTYGKYFDSKFGDDPVAALRAGVFNCWDGTNIVLAIARAFGFSGSRGHGTWNGVGHVWADIPGLGIIDPTAIQQRGSFTSSAVKGYSAGPTPRRFGGKEAPVGNKTINNTTEVHIHGPVYGVDDLEKAIDKGVQKANRRLFRSSYSGV